MADISDPSAPLILSTTPTNGTAKDLARSGSYLFVAVGAAGVDMLDVSNPANPHLVSNYNTSGYASRVAVNDSLVAVSDWDDIEILGFNTGTLTLKGYKNTGGRVMALEMVGNTVYSAEWSRFNIFEYETISAPDVDYALRKVEFPRVSEGFSHTIQLLMTNAGVETLIIEKIQLDNPNFTTQFDSDELNPGKSQPLSITYSPSTNNWIARLRSGTEIQTRKLVLIR